MKRLVSLVVFTVSILAFTVPSIAQAATKTTATNEPVGYDVSYPQCGKKLPSSASYAIIGINGGTTANTNPCLATQLAWAKKVVTKNTTKQPSLQLYVNTGNPGNYIADIMTWPTSNRDKTGLLTANPYGPCVGANNLACSWQYGWNRAEEALVDRFIPAAQKAGVSTDAADYTWWLDVEVTNTWQTGLADAVARNVASLEGMAAYFTNPSQGGAIGLYSTAVQWSTITGNTTSARLAGLPNWRPSGSTLANALINCKVAPLTIGGYISLTQYAQGGLDKNHSCI